MWNYSNYIKKVVEKSYYEMTRKYKLTNNEIAVISYLCEHEKDTATDIVNALLFSKSHVSTVESASSTSASPSMLSQSVKRANSSTIGTSVEESTSDSDFVV